MLRIGEYEIRKVREHFEVFRNGSFQFSADSVEEALEEIKSTEG